VFAPSNPFRPFCGERCKSLDLGAWADEAFRVPVRPEAEDAAPEAHNLRIPRDGGHDSMLMADSVPPSSRTPFHDDGGQHSILKADTLAVS
jgi:endogenous inhibitor of DNA gyrase (YacG/DUF329 family)